VAVNRPAHPPRHGPPASNTTKKRPRPGTPWSGPSLPLVGLGSFLDPLTCERSNARSLTLIRAVGGSGRPSALGLRRRPATSPSASQVPRPGWLPSRRRPARWLTSLLCLRMTNAIVHTGRIKNAPTVFTLPLVTSRIKCLRWPENMFYGISVSKTATYETLNFLHFSSLHENVNKLIPCRERLLLSEIGILKLGIFPRFTPQWTHLRSQTLLLSRQQ
jgi:hypothetical protein